MYDPGHPHPGDQATDILPPNATPGGSDNKLPVPLHVIVPQRPMTVAETGLELESLEEFALNLVGAAGVLTGAELAERMRLPLAGVVEEAVTALRKEGLIEHVSVNQALLGSAGNKIRLTERGSQIERRARERNGYVGPAPVSRASFERMLRQQVMARRTIKRAEVWRRFSDLVLADPTVDLLGSALEVGGPILLHGPSGSGKTTLAGALSRMFSTGIFIPYAVDLDGLVLRVYDPRMHTPLPLDERAIGVHLDQRWVYCQTPLVRVGLELQPSNLELTYNDQQRYYEAPLQLQAAGGVLLLDDLGTQRARAADLVTRVLEPIASGADYLRTVSGQRLPLPFTPLVVLATSLDPTALLGEALLRRIPCKIRLDDPSEEQFEEIVRRACASASVEFTAAGFQHLLKQHYTAEDRPLRAGHPVELARLVAAVARYKGAPAAFTPDFVDVAVAHYFIS